MDVTPLIPEGRQIIQSYSAGNFKINGAVYSKAVIVSPLKAWEWNAAPKKFDDLREDNFADLIDMSRETDIFLLGTGAKAEFFPPMLRQALKQRGVVIDAMDTGAACRTYNVLMAEGRRIVAALLPLQ